jgi:hypothetical protein
MTIDPKIWTLPAIPIMGQLFHVPGAADIGGLTSGGAQIITPEPGGFGVLEIEPSLHTSEWLEPFASWIMSKLNGQILRVRLAPTPQIAWSQRRLNNLSQLWINDTVSNDAEAKFTTVALEGTTEVVIDLTPFGRILRPGHVIGHQFNTYLIEEIEYTGSIATASILTPLRYDIAINDVALLRPYFQGRIGNRDEVRSTYRSADNGHIQMGKIVLNEANV